MKKIIDYKIASGRTIEEVLKEMKFYMGKGYQPLGGLAVHDDNLYQAIIKEKENAEKDA